MLDKVVLTQEGYIKIQSELKQLIDIKRPKAVDRLRKARDMGDLSESSEYASAREELSFIDERIHEIEDILKKGQIIKQTTNKQIIEVGSKIEVQVEGKKEIFTIVGEGEAEPKERKLSHTSPIGKALIGKKVGEIVEVKVPAGKVIYKILDIK
jgi:transcription elongation factor GreA